MKKSRQWGQRFVDSLYFSREDSLQEAKRSAHSNANKIISPEVCLLIDSVLREEEAWTALW